MKKEELFYKVLCIVEECTGVNRECILRSKTEESTDARVVLIYVLSRYLADSQIARMMHITPRGVNYLRNTFSIRSSKWFVRTSYESVSRHLEINKK